MITPPDWMLWLCVAWCALTAVLCLLAFAALAWSSRRFRNVDLTSLQGSRAAAEGDSLLGTLEDRDHIDRSHG